MGNEASKHRRWFEGLDADNDGDLGLRELLEIQKLEGDIQKSVLSPSLLFRFDMDQDGALDLAEFDKLMKHLKREKKKRILQDDDEKEKEKEEEEVWNVLDQRSASLLNFSRDGDTPLLTGQGGQIVEAELANDLLAEAESEESEAGESADGDDGHSSSGQGCSDDSQDNSYDSFEDPRDGVGGTPLRSAAVAVAASDDDYSSHSTIHFGGVSESVAKEESEGDDEVIIGGTKISEEEVTDDDDAFSPPLGNTPGSVGSPPRLASSVDSNDADSAKLIEESKKSLSRILSTVEGKKKYMKWLFRLADAEDKGQVNVEELSLILKAVSLDGLICNDLTFDDDNGVNQGHDYGDIARRIMREFDTGKDGLLSEPEFNVLAELIVQKYAAAGESEDKVVLDRYRIKRVLGQGAVGVVKLASNLKSGKSVAIKIIDSSQVQDFTKIDLEIKAMLMLKHPNVVRLFKVLESNDKIYLVMELCGGGTLADMVRIKPLSESLARFYMRQLIPAIKYCHQQGVIHRDIKLENLLLTNRGNLKISDFGHAGIYRKGWDLFSTSLVGSLWHISPEQVNGTVYKGSRIDIWALGVVLYRLLSGGRPPFYSDVASEVLDMITHARFAPLETAGEQANDLIAKILVVDPQKRLSLKGISRHDWMKYGQESIPRLEAIDLIMSHVTDVDAQWQAMCLAATELRVVFTVPTDQVRHLELHRMHCHYPLSELKFFITMLRVSDSVDDPPFFEFHIRSGETSEFQDLVERLRKTFKTKLAQLLKGRGGLITSDGMSDSVDLVASGTDIRHSAPTPSTSDAAISPNTSPRRHPQRDAGLLYSPSLTDLRKSAPPARR